ncbi:MAG TPA: hypothetical protein VN999_02115 [Thermoanaerobaculia bacterium]|nr:hypothetical protein [Thermoanaerobaculia bacterium]
MTTKLQCALLAAGVALLVPAGMAAGTITTGTILYGGAGGLPPGEGSVNVGAVVIVDQTTAALTIVGSPEPGTRLSGIAFDSTGALYGSTEGSALPPITSTLILIAPDTGALISAIGPITDGPGGLAIGISDLSVQPGSDVLFGIRAPTDLHGGAGKLYTIDKTTAVATLVGVTPVRRDSIAFAPDGTLYEAGFTPGVVPPTLYTLDPTTGAPLSAVLTPPADDNYGSLAVRPTDNVLFGGDGAGSFIFTIDPVTGNRTQVGSSTGNTFIGALSFRACVIDIAGATASPSSLWPPNHKLVNVAIGYTATDTCGAAAPVTCSLSIASNEGSSADWSVVDAHDVQLRATRDGGGNGRIYTVTITCTDTAGAASNAAVTVTVPHDQGN